MEPYYGIIPLLANCGSSMIISTQQGSPGQPGPAGPSGVSVVTAEVRNPAYHLYLLLSDGTEIDAGYVRGPAGPSGSCGLAKTVLVDRDYLITPTDFYMGVISEEPVALLLPDDPENGTSYIVKIETGPPIGNRKVTLKTDDGTKIDGRLTYVLQNPYESVSVIFRGNEWHIV